MHYWIVISRWTWCLRPGPWSVFFFLTNKSFSYTLSVSCIIPPSGPWSVILFSPLQLDAIVQQCRFWTGQPMIDIFRPTQPLDGRVVYRSSANAAPTGAVHLWFGVVSAMLGITGLSHWPCNGKKKNKKNMWYLQRHLVSVGWHLTKMLTRCFWLSLKPVTCICTETGMSLKIIDVAVREVVSSFLFAPTIIHWVHTYLLYYN